MSNADKIRSMTNKELAEFLAKIHEVTDDDDAFSIIEDWLGQEVEDDQR